MFVRLAKRIIGLKKDDLNDFEKEYYKNMLDNDSEEENVKFKVKYKDEDKIINPYHVELQLINMIKNIIENDNSIKIEDNPFIFSVLLLLL